VSLLHATNPLIEHIKTKKMYCNELAANLVQQFAVVPTVSGSHVSFRSAAASYNLSTVCAQQPSTSILQLDDLFDFGSLLTPTAEQAKTVSLTGTRDSVSVVVSAPATSVPVSSELSTPPPISRTETLLTGAKTSSSAVMLNTVDSPVTSPVDRRHRRVAGLPGSANFHFSGRDSTVCNGRRLSGGQSPRDVFSRSAGVKRQQRLGFCSSPWIITCEASRPWCIARHPSQESSTRFWRSSVG